jgi:hypothetical protein
MFGISLAIARPSQLPIMRTLTPISAWSCSIFSPGLRPCFPPQLWQKVRHHQCSTSRALRLQHGSIFFSACWHSLVGVAHLPVRVPASSSGLLIPKANPDANTRTLPPYQSGRAQSLRQDCAHVPSRNSGAKFEHHQIFVTRGLRLSQQELSFRVLMS